MENILLQHLGAFKSDKEKQKVYESLAFLGLYHYYSFFSHDTAVRRDNLVTLTSKYFESLLTHVTYTVCPQMIV
jgi:hypothetical protein